MSHMTPDTGSTVTEQPPTDTSAGSYGTAPDVEPTLWAGWIIFGSMMMLMLGSFHVVQGLVALFKDDYYLVTQSGLSVNVDFTTWGWTHLILGGVVFGTGIGVLYGYMWARITGVVIAMASALVNIAFLSAYPLWSALMIALDVVVIWALTVHGAEMKAAHERSMRSRA